jgi:hypothetical protein
MIFFFFFFVMLYSNFEMNTLKKIPGVATVGVRVRVGSGSDNSGDGNTSM